LEGGGIGDLEDTVIPDGAKAVSPTAAILGDVDVARLYAKELLYAESGRCSSLH
jgi:hypothetical protein